MVESRTNSVGRGELLVPLRHDIPVPLHRQIESEIRLRIRQGRLRSGTRMPSTRTLAADLGLSRGVVVEAYEQLIAEGYLVSQAGGYTEVAAGTGAPPPPPPQPPANMPTIDFRSGRPDVSQFPRAAWLRSVRRVLNEAPHERLSYLDGQGAPELLQALADYLNRVRGTAAQPATMMICNGFTQGFALLARELAADGRRRLAVEDPSDDHTRKIASEAGLDVVGVPVGEHGIDTEALGRSQADTVLVTAAHQFPTGAVLPAASRSMLIDWASRHDALVIEDDYDAEYRYDRTPIGAIQGLSPERVVYAGSASKTLAPGLRIGWLLLPSRLVEPIAAAKLTADLGSPGLDQLAFADFLTCGEFDRHLRRMRTIYRRRRDALLDALATMLPDFRPVGISAGLHVLTWLPEDIDESTLVTAAARRRLGVYGISPFRLQQRGPGGLLFGYAGLSERTIIDGIRLLADVVGSLR
jgi:GntR family transcriptional regulator/MocR family aminotransferase